MARVLLVDDDALLNKINATHFQARGIQTFSTDSGEVAWSLLQQDYQFDIVLIDLLMPGMSGMELLKKIKLHPQLKALTCICLTNLIGDATAEQTQLLGASACLFKDHFTPQLLVEEVIKYIPGFGKK